MDFGKFFGFGKKNKVYLSITPCVGLELIEIDIQAKTVKNYAYRPLEYNDSLRQVADISAFKNAVTELFGELNISLKSEVILNLPMVLLGSKELPLLLADDAVTEALTSEVEQSYIFKRYEPVISWIDAVNQPSGDTRKLFYSAIQKNTIEDIKNALSELGATLAGIEISLTSLLRALAFSGLLQEQMKDGMSWNLMIVSQNGYSICSMIGDKIVDYYEEPLAIKSFEGEEIYSAINASAQITLMSYPANYLCVVSETDLVSAELLTNKMSSVGVVGYLDNNSFKKQDVIPVSLEVLEDTAKKISLEAIGVGVSGSVNMPVKFNFTGQPGAADSLLDNPDEPVPVVLGSKEFDISPNNARNIAFVLAIAVLVPVILIFLLVPIFVNKKQALLDEVNSNLQKVEAEVKTLEDELNRAGDFDVNSEIKKVLGTNRAKLIAYTALGEAVPKKLWLTYFTAKDDGKFDIKGEASNVEDVYTFYRNMKDSLIDTKLRLHKLEMKSGSVDDAVTIDPNAPSDYEFEVTNMTADELNPQPAKPAQTEQTQQTQQTQSAQDTNNSGTNNKTLLNFGKNK